MNKIINRLTMSFIKSKFFKIYFQFESFPNLNKIKRSENNVGPRAFISFGLVPAMMWCVVMMIGSYYVEYKIRTLGLAPEAAKMVIQKTIQSGTIACGLMIVNSLAAILCYFPLIARVFSFLSAWLSPSDCQELFRLFSKDAKVNNISFILAPVVREFVANPKSFCAKHFNKSGSGFLEFMTSRVKVDNDFLYYAMSIPRKSELSVDALRRILLAYQPGVFKGVAKLEEVFSHYTLEQIERIFTFVGDKGVIFSSLPLAPAPVVESFNELAGINIPQQLLIFDNSEINGFSFKILKTKCEYNSTSDEFNNCVRTKFNNGNSLIVAYKDGKGTCIEVSGLSITQMASNFDKISLHRKELSKLFKSKGFNVKFTLPHIF